MNTLDRPMHPMSAPRRMAPTDALFWYAETALPIFRPIIGGLFILDRAPDPQGLEESLDAALALMPRLRQHVIEAPMHLGLPAWADDPHFDRSYLLWHLALPAPPRLQPQIREQLLSFRVSGVRMVLFWPLTAGCTSRARQTLSRFREVFSDGTIPQRAKVGGSARVSSSTAVTEIRRCP